MKVDTMRSIDYWLGVPFCFLATLILVPLNRIRSSSSRPANVLFIELSEMGSAVLADPAMRKMRDRANCRLFFAIFNKNKPSLGLLKTVPDENIFTIREKNLFLLLIDTIRFLFWSRRNSIDTVIDLELFSRFTALLTGFSGARTRVGYFSFHNEGLYRGRMMTHEVLYNPHIHIAKNFIALVNAALSTQPETPYSKSVVSDTEIELAKVNPDRTEIEQFVALVKSITDNIFKPGAHKLVLINANASELLIQRRWMPDHYVDLIKMVLSDYPEVLVLLTGSKSEFEEMEELCRQVNDGRCFNTAGQFTFEQLPLLYSVSHMMVTNDSGPGHFSAVTDLKVFVLYGPETPALYGSLGNSVPIYKGLACSPCVNASNHRKTECGDNVCLSSIKPADVYELISPSLKSEPKPLPGFPA